jgi:flagellar hook-associated protein FlgK
MTVGITQSLQGLQRAEAQFNQAAQNIAREPTSSTPQGDRVDLSAELVALLDAKNNFEANTKALKVGDEMTQTLLKAVG